MFLANVKMEKVGLASAFLLLLLLLTLLVPSLAQQLRFDKAKGEFKILQVADMHFADGKKTPCEDVLPSQFRSCSDLNTSSFLHRIILSEKPHLIVFTGDNIYGFDATDAVISMNAAFAPAIASNIPWAAVLGNHDQESTLSREGVMKYVVGMKHTLSRLNPTDFPTIDGFGNYNLQVHGVEASNLANKSLLNFYFLDSGDYSTVPSIPGYGWIKPSQQLWFQRTSRKLRTAYMKKPEPQKSSAPGLAYFHIPLPEYASFDSSNFTGVKQEGISSPSVNSGFFTTMVEEGDVKAVFTGHDHLNDFCGELTGIHLCYAGGFGYHAYGKAGWARRARVVVASLEKTDKGGWGSVKSIKTWKRLDDAHLTPIDRQVLWSKNPSEIPLTNKQGHHIAIKMNSLEEWKLVFEMVAVNLALAVVNILLKKVLCEGMNHLLIIAYRQSISTIFLIPIAYFLERKSRPKLTARILCALFLSALLGATLSQYFFLMGLKHTSATFTCAFINMVPVNTFLIAILFRLEKVDMENKSGRGKVLGALVCIGGVLILALYQGKALAVVPTKQSTARADLQTSQYGTNKKWAVGSVFLTAGSLVWSSWFLLQARIGKSYPCQYSSTAIMSFFSAIQSAILYLINNQNIHMSSWIVKGKLEIVTVIYAGTVGSGLCYVVMSWCVKQRGPVFTSAFSPLIQIFVALFEVLFLQEQIRLGSVVGSGLVIAGMYILLWGKSKEATEKASECDEVR